MRHIYAANPFDIRMTRNDVTPQDGRLLATVSKPVHNNSTHFMHTIAGATGPQTVTGQFGETNKTRSDKNFSLFLLIDGAAILVFRSRGGR